MKRYTAFPLVLAVLMVGAAALALTFRSRTDHSHGKTVGTVLLDKTPALSIESGSGGLSASERADIAAKRLSSIKNLVPEDITVGRVGGHEAVLGRGQVLITADAGEASDQRMSEHALALSWRDQLRSAIGARTGHSPMGSGPNARPYVRTSQKVVPILSIGSGLRVGAALVAGSEEDVRQVKAVAQIEGTFGHTARVRALVPVSTEDVVKNVQRVPGTAVIAVADIKL